MKLCRYCCKKTVSRYIELTSYEIALFMGYDNFGDNAGPLGYQTSETNLLTSNIDGSKNKEEQVGTEPVAVDEIYKQGCDSSEWPLSKLMVCDKAVTTQKIGDVPTGEFLLACRVKQEDFIHPEHRKAFEEVNGKIDRVGGPKCFNRSSRERCVGLDERGQSTPGSVDEICSTAETMEGDDEKMEALLNASGWMKSWKVTIWESIAALLKNGTYKVHMCQGECQRAGLLLICISHRSSISIFCSLSIYWLIFVNFCELYCYAMLCLR